MANQLSTFIWLPAYHEYGFEIDREDSIPEYNLAATATTPSDAVPPKATPPAATQETPPAAAAAQAPPSEVVHSRLSYDECVKEDCLKSEQTELLTKCEFCDLLFDRFTQLLLHVQLEHGK